MKSKAFYCKVYYNFSPGKNLCFQGQCCRFCTAGLHCLRRCRIHFSYPDSKCKYLLEGKELKMFLLKNLLKSRGRFNGLLE